MVMERLTRRSRRTRQRTDTDVRSRSSIEVISIIRTEPFNWIAVAEYSHGTGVWIETIQFSVTHDYAFDPPARIITVSDADYTGDTRTAALTIDTIDNRSTAQVILDFLSAGRW